MNAYPILVGYDGSLGAGAALNWALAEATRRSAPLQLVYVHEWATTVLPVPAGQSWPDPHVRSEALAVIDETVARARTTHPAVSITGAVIDGPVTATLRNLSGHASVLVLGNRGLGGFTGLLAGSVAVGVATRAHCPVVVVRGCAPPQQPVVVGVDDSPDSDHAIGFAFEQAAARGVDLVAVRAWQPPPVPWHNHLRPLVYDGEELEAAERALAGQALHGWPDKHPQVAVRVRLMPSTAAHALITASADAQLVVVGSLGRGGLRELASGAGNRVRGLLGPVTRQLIHHAHCPVAVVRDTAEPA
jgi:nucleotide-binding universal stress UspA family protein